MADRAPASTGHAEPFAVMLSAAKHLFHFAQGEPRESSRMPFKSNTGIFRFAQDDGSHHCPGDDSAPDGRIPAFLHHPARGGLSVDKQPAGQALKVMLDGAGGFGMMSSKLLPTRHAERPRVGLFILGGVHAY